MLAKFDPGKHIQSDTEVPSISDYSEMETRSRLKRVAAGFVSSASSVVSSGSTVWAGSVAGDGPMGQHHRAHISAWNPAVCEEADEESNESTNSQMASQQPWLDSNSIDLARFLALLEEGKRLEEMGMLAKAETMYQTALEIKDIPESERNDSKLRIAMIYKESKNWDTARTFLSDILETSADHAASVSSAQLVLTQYKLAGVHLGMHELDQAEKYCKEAINTARRVYGRQYLDYLRAIHLLVVICESEGDTKLASPTTVPP
jgi:hypothetical protein